MIRRPPRSTLSSSSAASDVYKRQPCGGPSSGQGLPVARARLAPATDGVVGRRTGRPPHQVEVWHSARQSASPMFSTRPGRVQGEGRGGGPRLAWAPLPPSAGRHVFATNDSPPGRPGFVRTDPPPVSYTHLRAHETPEHLVCRLLLENKKNKQKTTHKT